jgi:cation diffusion facilitator CzcD-associated flavoprotein CzcO
MFLQPSSTIVNIRSCRARVVADMAIGRAACTNIPIPDTTYKILEQPLGTARKVRIVTIGAGASGINMIRTLRISLTNFTHVVYEKNPKVGGTWYENRYPGCKCDIPAHNYQYSWKPNPEWNSFFGSAEEIEAYFCRVIEDENLGCEIKTEHRVVEARWNEKGVWELRVEDLRSGVVFDDYCHFLLDASGILKCVPQPDCTLSWLKAI